MKIAVIGTGAVGGYYGALLAKNGFEVHFLLHSDFQHVKNHGLLVNSVNGDIKLADVNAYAKPEDMPPCDIAIIALKTTSNDLLKNILPHAVKPDAVIVTLQNGIGVEKQVSDILPKATIIGGLCFLCANKIGPGHIHHLDYGAIRMGQYRNDETPAGITRQLKMVSDIFARGTIQVELTGDLGRARWEKLAWNIPFNGLSVILNADTGQLINSISAQTLIRSIIREVIRAAGSCGHDIGDAFEEKMVVATRKMVPYKPSMKLDYEAKRPLEIGMIYQNAIHIAGASGFTMEKTQMIKQQLEYLDEENRLAMRS